MYQFVLEFPRSRSAERSVDFRMKADWTLEVKGIFRSRPCFLKYLKLNA